MLYYFISAIGIAFVLLALIKFISITTEYMCTEELTYKINCEAFVIIFLVAMTISMAYYLFLKLKQKEEVQNLPPKA